MSLEQDTATPGTFTSLSFRVPNETANGTSTNKLTLTLPGGASLLQSISYIPVPGWTTELVSAKLATPIKNGDSTIAEAVTQVIWSAKPGSEYGLDSEGIFSLFIGAIPAVGRITLPVDQGYTDGSIVSWNGSVTSDHPAPVLYIENKPVVDTDAGGAPIPSITTTTASSSTAAGPDVLARVLGGIGPVLGVVALLIAVLGRGLRRKAS